VALPTIAATATGSGSALTTAAFPGTLAVVTGQVVVVLVAQTATGSRDLTVTDDQGHTWTTQQTATNSRRAHIVTTVSTYTGNITITTSWNASATWQAEAFAINDADGGAAVDVSDQFTQTASNCFAAASTALDTSANVLVLAVYSCATSRTWTKDAAYTLEGSGNGYLFQSFASATALTDARSPALQSSTAVASAAASIAIKGSAGGGNVTLTADVGTFTLAGQDANLLASRVLPADAGAFVLAGQDASLLRSLVLTADAGTFTLAGQNAALTYSGTSGPFTLTAESGAFTLAGQSADLLMSRVLTAEAGSFALAGQAAGLTYSGATTTETPTSVIRLGQRSDTWRLPATSNCWRLPARE
jgi:hypothetical protein